MPAFPDGITAEHDDRPRGMRRHASPGSIVLLGGLIVAAFSGVLGGHPNPIVEIAAPEARMLLDTPQIIRNGEFFETRITVEARRPIGDVVIALSSEYWRDMTINSMIPAAADETFEDRMYRFSFGPLAAGKTLKFKIDGQINPPLFAGTRGTLALLDGDRVIAEHPLSLRVLP